MTPELIWVFEKFVENFSIYTSFVTDDEGVLICRFSIVRGDDILHVSRGFLAKSKEDAMEEIDRMVNDWIANYTYCIDSVK